MAGERYIKYTSPAESLKEETLREEKLDGLKLVIARPLRLYGDMTEVYRTS
jgi:hypothetical protein